MKTTTIEKLLAKGGKHAQRTSVDSLRDYRGRPHHVDTVYRAVVVGYVLAVVSLDGQPALLNDSILRPGHQASIIEARDASTGNFVHKSGSFVFLNDYWGRGYFHWISEQLPRVLLAERAGFDGRYVIPNGGPFLTESMAMLGISEGRIETQDDRCWAVDELCIPEQESGFYLPRRSDQFDLLRNIFLEAAGPGKATRRVNVHRDRKYTRHVVNQEEFDSLLTAYDFESIRFEELSFLEQIRTAAEAAVLMGPLGSGMTNCMFMTPGETLIELFPPTYIKSYHSMFIHALRLNYHMITSRKQVIRPYGYGENVEVYNQVLELVLTNNLGISQIAPLITFFEQSLD